jgi:hypothetical protein
LIWPMLVIRPTTGRCLAGDKRGGLRVGLGLLDQAGQLGEQPRVGLQPGLEHLGELGCAGLALGLGSSRSSVSLASWSPANQPRMVWAMRPSACQPLLPASPPAASRARLLTLGRTGRG